MAECGQFIFCLDVCFILRAYCVFDGNWGTQMSHDGAYHMLFSHPEMVEDLLKQFIAEPWVAQLDFSTLELLNSAFFSKGFIRREGDLIFRIQDQSQQPVYLYLLLEFQSTPDPWMAVRLQVYVGLLYQQLIRDKRLTSQGLLPPVFPLVLYNGDTPWQAATNLSSLIQLPPNSALWPCRSRSSMTCAT